LEVRIALFLTMCTFVVHVYNELCYALTSYMYILKCKIVTFCLLFIAL